MDSFNIKDLIHQQENTNDNQQNRQEPHLLTMGTALGNSHQNDVQLSNIARHPNEEKNLSHSETNRFVFLPDQWQKNLSTRIYERPSEQVVMDYSFNSGLGKFKQEDEAFNLKGIQTESSKDDMNRNISSTPTYAQDHDEEYGIIDIKVRNVAGGPQSSCKLVETVEGRDQCEVSMESLSYTCGHCDKQFNMVCKLHYHLLTHRSTGVYFFNIDSLTAHFKDDGICGDVQTTERGDGLEMGDDISEAVIENETQNIEQDVTEQNWNDNETEQPVGTCSDIDNKTLDVDSNKNKRKKKYTAKQQIKINKTKKKTKTRLDREIDIKQEFDVVAQGESSEKKFDKHESVNSVFDNENYVSNEFWESNTESSDSDTDATEDLDYKPEIQERQFKCNKCGKTYKFESKLNLHMERHHSDISNGEDKILYVCRWCQETFVMKKEMVQHKRKCLKNDKLKCWLCKEIIPNKQERMKHIQSHENRADLTCKICNKTMTSLNRMQTHMKRHNGRKLVQCDKCGRAYWNQYSLKKHVLYCNNEEQTFECPICSKKFKTQDAVKHHISVHSEEKKCVCHICGFAAIKLDYLRRHLSVHSEERPFSCEVCGLKFKTHKGLSRHKKIHTNTKNCVCQYCGKAFTNNWNLKTHLRQHTGDTPYKCKECGMGFKQNVLVKLHMKSHHPYC